MLPTARPTLHHPDHPQLTTVPPQDNYTLRTAQHAYIRIDATRHSLQPLFRGLYPVLSCHSKTFEVQVTGLPQWFSVDRLKPAFISSDSSNCML